MLKKLLTLNVPGVWAGVACGGAARTKPRASLPLLSVAAPTPPRVFRWTEKARAESSDETRQSIDNF
jgi:hypothetical protein